MVLQFICIFRNYMVLILLDAAKTINSIKYMDIYIYIYWLIVTLYNYTKGESGQHYLVVFFSLLNVIYFIEGVEKTNTISSLSAWHSLPMCYVIKVVSTVGTHTYINIFIYWDMVVIRIDYSHHFYTKQLVYALF